MEIEQAKKAWGELNSAPYDENSVTDRAALFLLCALDLNNSYLRVAAHTGLDPMECRLFKKRGKDTGIIKGRKIHCDWLDEDTGGIAFIMDAMCLAGLLERKLTPPLTP